MTKYIAHASIDERGKVSGGSAGDQTGKEVCIRTWYNKPWGHVLRIKDANIRKQFANNMIDIAKNNKIGYDQSQRNSLLTQAVKVNFDFSKISAACECDCSSAITVAILGAIYKVKGKSEYEKVKNTLYAGSNCRTTSTLRGALLNLGMITVYTSSTYVAGTSKAVFGDIYLKEGKHVVCYIDNGNKVGVSTQNNASASSSSKNSIVALGQQHSINFTGVKIAVDSIRGTNTKKNGIRCVQHAMNLDYKSGLAEDGDFGAKSNAALGNHYVKKGETQHMVTALEILLMLRGYDPKGVECPGEFGSGLEAAVYQYQKDNDLTPDKIAGPKTFKSLMGV